jgi:hypothetical protein
VDFVIRGSFDNPDSAQLAYSELLNACVRIISIAFRSRFRTENIDYPPNGYDPIGGARLSGRVFSTLAATGYNLIGNSSTVDVSLGDFPEILEKAAADENTDKQHHMPPICIETVIKVQDEFDKDSVKRILAGHGAKNIRCQIKNTKKY